MTGRGGGGGGGGGGVFPVYVQRPTMRAYIMPCFKTSC